MAEALYELLLPYFRALHSAPNFQDPITSAYISELTSHDLPHLTTEESQSLSQSSQSLLRSIQALAKRSHKSITASASSLSSLSSALPSLSAQSQTLNDTLPSVESKAAVFAEKYRKSNESNNPVLSARKNALLLARNVDRLNNVLDLPTLLSSAVSSGQPSSATTGNTVSSTASSSVNYGSALDLHAHVRRLTALYPESELVASIAKQSEREMRLLTTNLIASLRTPGIKLATAMRTVGWLRRVAPELDEQFMSQKQGKGFAPHLSRSTSFQSRSASNSDGTLGALFLVCRLASLSSTLEALEPLRELADQETVQRKQSTSDSSRPKGKRRESAVREKQLTGQQTEKYLKRYIEIFREQSFAIVSMYRSIFPSALSLQDTDSASPRETKHNTDDIAASLLPLPSPLATFPAHLVEVLFTVMKTYLPNVTDQAAKDSLMTQILYCAGSLGRLGGDFSLMLAVLEEELAEIAGEDQQGEEQWARVVKKHRVQASRLELLASGVGTSKPMPRDIIVGVTN